jgi:uncharacterized protein YqcC (DUF446 family)
VFAFAAARPDHDRAGSGGLVVKKIKKRKRGKAGSGPFLQKLEEIEGELRSLGWWRAKPIDPFAHLSPEEPRSYLDASTFEDWLQFVFLPNARGAAQGGTLPTSSNVGLMAQRQYDYHEHVVEAQALIRLLSEFDEMVVAYHARQGGRP